MPGTLTCSGCRISRDGRLSADQIQHNATQLGWIGETACLSTVSSSWFFGSPQQIDNTRHTTFDTDYRAQTFRSCFCFLFFSIMPFCHLHFIASGSACGEVRGRSVFFCNDGQDEMEIWQSRTCVFGDVRFPVVLLQGLRRRSWRSRGMSLHCLAGRF